MKAADVSARHLLLDETGTPRNEIRAPQHHGHGTREGHSHSYVGSPVERTEDLRFLRGEGQYVGDIKRDGQWHAAIVRSPYPHGIIRGIDASAALAIPGMRAVITGADVAEFMQGPMPTIPFRRPNPDVAPYAQPVVATDRVRYVGEPVAIVLADTAALAEDALPGVVVDIDTLPAIVDWRTSEAGATLLFEGTKGNIASTFSAQTGDTDAAFAKAPYTRRETFKVQRQTALPMETRGLLAEWDEARGRLTVHGAAKLPFFNRRAMAAMMGLDESAVDYIELDVGGGFGARGEFYPEDFLVAFAARKLGRPIKWIEDRREHFLSIAHAREMEAEVEIACELDGTIVGMRGTLHVDIGGYVRPNGITPVRNAAQFLTGPYRIPNIRIDARAILSNKVPAGTYRGPGRYEGCFFCERMVELAAGDLGIDRVEMRRRNVLIDTDMPHALATVLPNDGFGETSCDSGDYRITLDQCLAEFGWNDRKDKAGQLIDGLYHGVAVGCFIEGGASGPRENARLELGADGQVMVYVGSSAIGQGLETILAQIAADALEVPFEQIRILHGSTTYLKEGFGSYGSRSTVMGGSAIVLGAKQMLAKFRDAAAQRLGVGALELVVSRGEARTVDGRVVRLADFAGDDTLTCDSTFSSSKATYTYGAAAAHVTVDPGTGRVDVLDYLVVDDVGRIINPLTLHGQVMGAAVQGYGSVFSEHLAYDEHGQLLVGSLADYMIPLATDFPHVRAMSIEMFPSPNNPLGAKGAGEGGIIPVGGVLTNAIASALSSLGVQPRQLPLTPPRVWELIQEAKARLQS